MITIVMMVMMMLLINNSSNSYFDPHFLISIFSKFFCIIDFFSILFFNI